MTDPKIIQSRFCTTIEAEGTSVEVSIYRLEDETEWTLEVIDENWNSTVWEDKFASDEDALAEAIATINTEGIWSFVIENSDDDERPLMH